ncbi:DsbA family protein [Tunicatimonas pelagia]|uniref:DsbA family protein n=1 Tax=Tunicatimonas pelagia TaxID=931531 RepID=UPI002666E2D8|nr:DsbA family protein [Tunicatimonas pelagia]WKN40428.1 DsbA family protein [Tunicatimonas pelagia]
MKIIYAYDALCGWCYGFSSVMEAFYQKHQKRVDFEVLSGGMVTGERIGPIGKVAPYIQRAYRDVEKSTEVKFGKAFLEDILEEGTTVFNSMPLAIALSVFKSYRANEAVLFASALQKAIYYDGTAPEDTKAYGLLAEAFGIDGERFTQQMKEDAFLAQTQQEFQRTQQLGVQGFPTVFAEVKNTHHPLTRGYTPLNELENRFTALSQHIQ